MHLSQGSLLREDSTYGVGLEKMVQYNLPLPARSPAWLRRSLKGLEQRLGSDHKTGVIYGVVNWIVCVPSLVSYAHIVFPQAEFRPFLPMVVKIYFLSSAVMQVVMTVLSDVEFSIGQIQDVGLIFLAGMVRNLVAWGKEAGLSGEELITTSIWQSAISTCFVGISLILIGKMKLIQYVTGDPRVNLVFWVSGFPCFFSFIFPNVCFTFITNKFGITFSSHTYLVYFPLSPRSFFRGSDASSASGGWLLGLHWLLLFGRRLGHWQRQRGQRSQHLVAAVGPQPGVEDELVGRHGPGHDLRTLQGDQEFVG